jgi:hypothetical protein
MNLFTGLQWAQNKNLIYFASIPVTNLLMKIILILQNVHPNNKGFVKN